MTRLNWRDASKELPTQVDDDGLPSVCLVVSFVNNKPYFYKDWISGITKKWTNTNHDDVKHWIYLDEIPDHVKYWIYLDEIPLPEE